MVRYDEGHRERTQTAIIDAASLLLRDRGFSEASVGNVMKAVGLTHGGFYAHFPDKTAMLTAAVERAFVQSPINFSGLARMAKATSDTGVIAKHYLSEGRVADVATGCPVAALVSEIHRQDKPVQDAFQLGSVETMQALAAAPGLSRADQDFAWAAFSMLVGGLSLMRAMPDEATKNTIRDQIILALRKLGDTVSSDTQAQNNQSQDNQS
jgi:TetR/AcrR family transcriptional regulator, transcriptional repressor for nem operon